MENIPIGNLGQSHSMKVATTHGDELLYSLKREGVQQMQTHTNTLDNCVLHL